MLCKHSPVSATLLFSSILQFGGFLTHSHGALTHGGAAWMQCTGCKGKGQQWLMSAPAVSPALPSAFCSTAANKTITMLTGLFSVLIR